MSDIDRIKLVSGYLKNNFFLFFTLFVSVDQQKSLPFAGKIEMLSAYLATLPDDV